MKKTFNKLVRDNIIDIIKNDNKVANYRVLNNDEYINELNKKLIEETNEYLCELDIEELADILEVVEALVIAKGYSLEDLNNIKNQKAIKNGKFEKRLFLESVNDNE